MDLSIRQAARETGLSNDTLRYYERIGLLGPVARNNGGQRRYRDTDIARLRFVKRAQAMDFSLEEIGGALDLSSVATVHKHVGQLIAKGYLRRERRNASRDLEVVAGASTEAAAFLPARFFELWSRS